MLFYRLREARTTPDGRPIAPPMPHMHIFMYVYICIYHHPRDSQSFTPGPDPLRRVTRSYIP